MTKKEVDKKEGDTKKTERGKETVKMSQIIFTTDADDMADIRHVVGRDDDTHVDIGDDDTHVDIGDDDTHVCIQELNPVYHIVHISPVHHIADVNLVLFFLPTFSI